MHKKFILFLTSFVCYVLMTRISYAQQPYLPTQKQMVQAYADADRLDTLLRKAPIITGLRPNWLKDGNVFWYSKAGKKGDTTYYSVDAKKGTKSKLADKPAKLGLMGNNYDPAGRLQARRSRWDRVKKDRVSPDKRWLAKNKDGNIFIKDTHNGTETQFTTNGSLEKPYTAVSWSPDSKHFVAYLTDPKTVKQVHYVLSSEPGTTRGVVKSHDYQQPGEDFTSYEQYVGSLNEKTILKTNTDKIDFFGEPELHWRTNDCNYFTYEKVDRGHQRFRVIEVEVKTGNTSNIIDEKTKTFIYEQRIYTYYLPKTREILWITEKDGYRHIYLLNEAKKSESLITKGDWVVRDIDSVDIIKRVIWFSASGRNKGEDPYFIHNYRVGFDGKNLVDLTPEKGNHTISFSPDRQFYIDSYSEVNIAPSIVLKKTADAHIILELEKSDLNDLIITGVRLPEVFVAKGRDGKTDIWGVVYRPAHMEAGKSYPVIENIYAGPQDSFVPKSFSVVNEMESMAQLGFIVVQIDGMGTANRSKAFHDYCWQNLRDAGFEDRILWIKALANKYPEVDVSRVGVYGTSAGGQNSAGALLFHPEFYKAAVSACGCHDNRIDKQWWNEQWMGYPIGPHYEKQSNITNAGSLKGNLLLIVGEADNNVPPESTLRFADALIKKEKMFDLLVVPGMGHSDGGSYGRKKKRDFFVKHLLGIDAPGRN
jgi:dipeptidyl aminopeptidase/acylaminoacyl peptidase